MTRRVSALVLSTLLGLLTAAPRAQEEEVRWLGEEPAGIFPIEVDEANIDVRGIRGNIELRRGKTRELRWSSTAAQGARPLPLAVGTKGRTIVLTVPPGDLVPRTVSLTVPDGVVLRLEAEGTQISGTELDFSLFVSGPRLDVQLTSCSGTVDLDLQGGKGVLRAMGGAAAVRGRPDSATVSDQLGPLTVAIGAGAVAVRNAQGGMDLDLEGGTVTVDGALAPFRARASGSQLEVRELHGGGDFDLTATPLILEKTEGEITIRSDGAVQFKEIDSELRVHGIGATVRGAGNRRLVEVITDSAEIALGRIDGPLRIQGNSLNIRLEDLMGATTLFTSGSAIDIRGITAPLVVENEIGDLVVREASDTVQVKSRRGNVTLLGLRATANVESEGDVVAVSWSSLTGKDESVLTNSSGEIRVELPPGGGYLVEARAKYGRVHSTLAWLRLQDDGRSAAGVQGRGQMARIRIEADGDVTLSGSGAGLGSEPEQDPAEKPAEEPAEKPAEEPEGIDL